MHLNMVKGRTSDAVKPQELVWNHGNGPFLRVKPMITIQLSPNSSWLELGDC